MCSERIGFNYGLKLVLEEVRGVVPKRREGSSGAVYTGWWEKRLLLQRVGSVASPTARRQSASLDWGSKGESRQVWGCERTRESLPYRQGQLGTEPFSRRYHSCSLGCTLSCNKKAVKGKKTAWEPSGQGKVVGSRHLKTSRCGWEEGGYWWQAEFSVRASSFSLTLEGTWEVGFYASLTELREVKLEVAEFNSVWIKMHVCMFVWKII